MSATPIRLAAGAPAGMSRRLLSSEVLIRFALVAAAVCLCYSFEWRWLRSLTADLNTRLDLLGGVRLERISWDVVAWNGALYRYVIACTFADAWCGAIPLLWNLKRSALRNLLYVLAFGGALLIFNVVRLSLSDVFVARGLSWDIAHNVVSGVSYFIVWEWIWHTRSWGRTRENDPEVAIDSRA